uniref:Bridge-like lipid transfer protein family member 1 N-terminal domain-containing protein n=1 Tax=Parascaris equorum TaxID=6256 RepID=A0A914RZA9_PAREQ
MNVKYVIDVRNFLALRVWLPTQSPLAPVLHSLMKNAHFTCSQPAATALPTISSPSQVEIGESEILLTGITIKLIIDLKNNYFGLYDQLTDVVSTDGASRLFGDILYEVEYYRPLALRLGLCLRSSKAHCLVHSTHTDASFPGPWETMVQVGFPEGIIALKTFSFRGHAFFSEIDIPWDAGSVEYAWLMEILIGTINGKIHPTQVPFEPAPQCI